MASGASLLASHNQSYNGTDGNQIGTNRIVTETREHFGRMDAYRLDSKYRMVEFTRDSPQQDPTAGLVSNRVLDDADKMTDFIDEGWSQNPILGTTGMNQYATFDSANRDYNDNGSLVDDGPHRHLFDFENRLLEIRHQNGQTRANYRYSADHRRVLKKTPASTTRFSWVFGNS